MVLIRVAIRHKSRSYLSTIGGGSTTETDRGDLRMKPLEIRISKFTQNDAASSYGIPGQEDVQLPHKAESVASVYRGARAV